MSSVVLNLSPTAAQKLQGIKGNYFLRLRCFLLNPVHTAMCVQTESEHLSFGLTVYVLVVQMWAVAC